MTDPQSIPVSGEQHEPVSPCVDDYCWHPDGWEQASEYSVQSADGTTRGRAASYFAKYGPGYLPDVRVWSPPFVDGTRGTRAITSALLRAGGHECRPGKPRKDCSFCNGYGTLCCEFPCWQRLGLTAEPCCPGCPPLDAPDEPSVATVTRLHPPGGTR